MALEMIGRDVFVRNTTTDGKTSVSSHRCHDADKFMASLADAAAKLNEQQPEGKPRKARVERITEDQYRKEK